MVSYEDLEEARAKRAAKEKATASKKKRGNKRKHAALGTGAPQVGPKVVQRDETPKPWKAPVAQMIAGDWF